MGKREETALYLSLGSNLGDRRASIQQAIEQIEHLVGRITRISSLYETPPWGYASENYFLNCCIEVSTILHYSELLPILHQIEADLGRQRTDQYADRPIDIDILLYGTHIIQEPNLIIPHPHMTARSFVMIPLAEIAAKFIHPCLFLTIFQLTKVFLHTEEIKKYKFAGKTRAE